MRRTLAFALLLAATACRSSATTPAPKPTAATPEATLAAQVLSLMDDPRWSYDAEQHRLKTEDGSRIELTKYVRDYAGADENQRYSIASRIVLSTRLPPTGAFEDERRRLFPVIRERLYFSSSMSPVPRRPFGGPESVFDVAVALDRPEALVIVAPAHLTAWNRSFDEVFAVAVKNVAPPSRERWTKTLSGFLERCGDEYASSVLASPEAMKALPKPPLVALLPTRSCLLVASERNESALLGMLDRGKSLVEEDARAQNLVSLRWNGAEWTRAVPSTTPEVKCAYTRAAVESMIQLYDAQRPRLQSALGDDVYVARMMAAMRGDLMFTFATWTKDVPTLLPKVEIVMLRDLDTGKDSDPLAAPAWETLMKIIGPRLHKTDDDPPRWRVDGFPTAAELAQLGFDPRYPRPTAR